MIPAEAAHATIYALGEVGLVQFKDLNEDKTAFQRTYANQVRHAPVAWGPCTPRPPRGPPRRGSGTHVMDAPGFRRDFLEIGFTSTQRAIEAFPPGFSRVRCANGRGMARALPATRTTRTRDMLGTWALRERARPSRDGYVHIHARGMVPVCMRARVARGLAVRRHPWPDRGARVSTPAHFLPRRDAPIRAPVPPGQHSIISRATLRMLPSIC